MRKKKKVAILTRTSTLNFGTILQSYALQNYIKCLEYDVLVVDDKIPRKLYNCDSNNKRVHTKTIREFIYKLYDKYVEKKRIHKLLNPINKFKRKYIKYYVVKSIKQLNTDFDIFISGSDQIWADTAEPEMFRFFMQDFVNDNKLKISYAVSVGTRKYSFQNESIVIDLLKKFEYISVREASSMETISKYVDKSIEITCDPVFLLDSERWKALSGKRQITEKYIFCYFLSNNAWYYDKIVEICKLLRYKVYIFCRDNVNLSNDKFIKINNCSPNDFLNYICHSEFTLTDSYHATLFSIIFGRSFCTLERFADSFGNIQNERIKFILNKLGLIQYYIGKKDKIIMQKYSTEDICVILKELKKTSIYFLKTALEREVGK